MLQSMIREAGLEKRVEVISCGTSADKASSDADRRSQRVASRMGLTLHHAPIQMTKEIFDRSDLLIGFEEKNRRDALALLGLAPSAAEAKKIRLIRDFDPEGQGNVADPWYGEESDFDEVGAVLERSLPALLSEVEKTLS